MRIDRSKQEQTLAYARAFSKERALTCDQMFKLQYKLFSYKRIDSIIDSVKKLEPKINAPEKDWCQFVSIVFRIVREPNTSPNLFSGNLTALLKRNKFIKRFKDDKNHWRYYLQS